MHPRDLQSVPIYKYCIPLVLSLATPEDNIHHLQLLCLIKTQNGDCQLAAVGIPPTLVEGLTLLHATANFRLGLVCSSFFLFATSPYHLLLGICLYSHLFPPKSVYDMRYPDKLNEVCVVISQHCIYSPLFLSLPFFLSPFSLSH